MDNGIQHSFILILTIFAFCVTLIQTKSVPTNFKNTEKNDDVSLLYKNNKDSQDHLSNQADSPAILKFHQARATELKVKNSEKLRKVNWYCDICKVIVGLVQSFVAQNKTKGEIATLILALCIKEKIYAPNVCKGAVELYKAEVLTVLDRLYLSPTEICGSVFGKSCGLPYDPAKMWYITFPDVPKPPLKPVVLPKLGMPTLRVLQLSDIHLESGYVIGGNSQCDEPVCCRAENGKPVGEPAGKWGTYSCDLPNTTYENTFLHLSHEHKKKKFDYIVFTGDIPAHLVWLSSKNDTKQKIYDLSDKFRKYFPGVPVYFTLGNHEAVPVNSFPPDWPSVPPTQREDWLYEACAHAWSPWLPSDTMETIKRGGFYTTLIKPGLRMVSMNMNYCASNNWWLMLNETDPVGHLEWLVQVLQKAEDNNEKVHIIGHERPGDCLLAWQTNFFNIINRYEQTVAAQIYGHLHYDSFEVFFDPASNLTRATSVAFMGPALETANSGFPSYREYIVDGERPQSTFMVLDHSTYVFNLTEANLKGNFPKWYQEYTAKEAFNMTSLLPSEWKKLVFQIWKDDVMFNKFLQYYFKSHPNHSQWICDEKCRKGHVCSMVIDPTKPNACDIFNITRTEYMEWQSKYASSC